MNYNLKEVMTAPRGGLCMSIKEIRLAEKHWEDTFAFADACLILYNEGFTTEDIAYVMLGDTEAVVKAIKLATAFPQKKRDKAVPIDVYQASSRYPDPQKMVEYAWEKRMYASDLRKDYAKYQGGTFPMPAPKKTERQTPIEIALGVDEKGMTSSKKLYAFLELNPVNYSRWVKKNIEENVFAEENSDYFSFFLNEECLDSGARGRFAREYKLTATFAKKLAMSSQTPKGEIAREYFIRVEQNAKALANGMLNCISPQNGAMRPDEAAQLILDTADNFKIFLPGVRIEKMIKTALELKGLKQVN